jgi:uncharacterized protein (TIGR03435 family)
MVQLNYKKKTGARSQQSAVKIRPVLEHQVGKRGLKLESRKLAVPVVVIDRVEESTPN